MHGDGSVLSSGTHTCIPEALLYSVVHHQTHGSMQSCSICCNKAKVSTPGEFRFILCTLKTHSASVATSLELKIKDLFQFSPLVQKRREEEP